MKNIFGGSQVSITKIMLGLSAVICAASICAAAEVPDIYRELAMNCVKALTEGSWSGLCNDDDSDGDLGGGVIYDGIGDEALARVGWTTIEMGGEAPLFVVGASDPGEDSSYIYGVWRAEGGKPQKMLVCSWRSSITIRRRDDGALMLRTAGSQSAKFFYVNWREVREDALPFVVRVQYDEVSDPDSPWLLDGEPSDEGRADAALDAIARRCEPVKLSFAPFADLAR